MMLTRVVENVVRLSGWILLLAVICSAQARELQIVAHRGANHLAPENTMAAALKCVELGVDYVEIDVRTSKDGILYILHDSTLDRTTNGTGAIRDRDSVYIDQLDAGSWFGPAFKGEKVPRLESYLRALKGKIKVYFDVKDADLEKLLPLIYANGFENNCFFWFSDDKRALELRRLDASIPLKMNAVDVDGLKRVLAFDPQIIEYRLPKLTPDFVAFARSNNLELMAHALEPGAEKSYPDIISSAATMVNLDRADVMLDLLAATEPGPPIRHTLEFNGEKREYYVWLPRDFDSSKTYWPLVSVHGGGGNGRTHFLARAVRQKADMSGLDVIVITPGFSNSDVQASRFPSLGEGEFLLEVLKQINRNYTLHNRILLTGYSRGGQFSHRFAFAHPEMVKAVAPFSAGTWTTPEGGLLIEGMDYVSDPRTYLANPQSKALAPERLHDIFNQRVADVAGLKPVPGAEKVPFLVMCGSLDTRFEASKAFALSLIEAGFDVEAGWPRTPHGGRENDEFKAEFEEYSQRAVEFFKRITELE